MFKVAIVGVGNRLFGDDGVGSIVAEILGACFRSDSVDVFVREILDTSVIHVLEDYDMVIFVDAIRGANVEKPVLYYVDLNVTSQEWEGVFRVVDPHNVDVMRLVLLALISGRLRAKVYLLGMPVEVLELGASLSRKAIEAIPLAVHIIERVLVKEVGLKDPLDIDCVNRWLRSRNVY